MKTLPTESPESGVGKAPSCTPSGFRLVGDSTLLGLRLPSVGCTPSYYPAPLSELASGRSFAGLTRGLTPFGSDGPRRPPDPSEPRTSRWNRHLACGHSRDGSVTSVHRPAEAGLVKAALKRAHSREPDATREFGVRNFSSALTSGLQQRGLRQPSLRNLPRG